MNMAFFTLRPICPSRWWTSGSLLVFCLIICACNKQDGPTFPKTPQISLKGISHDTIREYEDVLTISINYEDGDGDIGFADPDMNSIFIRDSRLTKFDGFYVGTIAPEGSSVPIQGTLNVEFPSLFLFGSADQESTRFFVYLRDRAGNVSDTLETPRVWIVRD